MNKVSMCDRCRVSGCLLNIGGKACQNARKETCPDVVYTKADQIRDMSDEGLAALLADIQEDALFLEGPITGLKYKTNWQEYLEEPAGEG